MEELRDLQEIYNIANEKFSQYNGKDFVLPSFFKEKVKEINNNTIEYNMYSAIITTRWGQNSGLNIYLPNQWFYVASYFTDFYNELQKYKKVALTIVTKDRLKELNGEQLTQSELSTLNQLPLNTTSKEFLIKFITDYSWWKGAKTIDRGDFYVSPILSSAKLVNASQSFVADLCAFLADKDDLVKAIIDGFDALPTGNNVTFEIYSQSSNFSSFRPFLTAIRSKPFLLLAGISGTGKSRIVRELARACWDSDSEEYKAQKPKNFEMIQVKPNWHDSTELIGYVSRASGAPEFVAGDFLKFVVKAWEDTKAPYFLCLDEMNLAPVEQYFAEYLSVIESRKFNGKEVVTDPILKKEAQEWYHNLVCTLTEDSDLQQQFLQSGISIPKNLIVIGTVNMDETTFAFSRKVLDRAMTIEMNEVDLHGGLTEKTENIGKINFDTVVGDAVEGVDVYADYQEVCDTAIDYLQSINDKLNGTPFKIAYRTRNEFLLYVVNNLSYSKDENDKKYVIARALDEITSMKILSRIEGDEDKTRTVIEDLKKVIDSGLKAVCDSFDTTKSVSLLKLNEMEKRLSSGYTSFWS